MNVYMGLEGRIMWQHLHLRCLVLISGFMRFRVGFYVLDGGTG